MASTTSIRLVAEPNNVSDRAASILNELQAACFHKDDHRKLDTSYWWLATVGKKPVGFAGLTKEDDNIGFLLLAGVTPSARGHGVHGRMLRARIKFARKLGLKKLITYTRLYNTPSANNLIDAGFHTYVPHYSWAGTDVNYWRKDL